MNKQEMTLFEMEEAETIVYQRTIARDCVSILIPVRLRIMQADVDNIMVLADERFQSWWIQSIQPNPGRYNSRYEWWEQIGRGGELLFSNSEDGRDYVLNSERFINGLLLYLRGRIQMGKTSPVFFDEKVIRIDTQQIHREEWDTIMQYALFGDIRYAPDI